tara:strand:- start:72 stop:833 length:762 start_codon:yes stop_codon:yes gene_type:complete
MKKLKFKLKWQYFLFLILLVIILGSFIYILYLEECSSNKEGFEKLKSESPENADATVKAAAAKIAIAKANASAKVATKAKTQASAANAKLKAETDAESESDSEGVTIPKTNTEEINRKVKEAKEKGHTNMKSLNTSQKEKEAVSNKVLDKANVEVSKSKNKLAKAKANNTEAFSNYSFAPVNNEDTDFNSYQKYGPSPQNTINFFGSTYFKPECCINPESSSYSNSLGCACLSPDKLRYLNSRGGNRTFTSEF